MTSSKRARSGFTLIELIMVVVIVGALMGLAAVRMEFLVPKYRLRGAAREVGALLKQAKSRAASTGKDVFFEVDLGRGEYGLLTAFPKPEGEGAPGEVEYVPLFSSSLPDGVQFIDVILGEKQKIERGRARVRISPFGIANHAIVNLRNEEKREIAVRMNGFTGFLTFYDGRAEADDLLEDADPQ